MTLLAGFEPVIKKSSQILILGSMPGVASLQKHQYYAHPRNAFWPIMEQLFSMKHGLPYEQRCAILSSAGVGVWDVLKSCRRTGSLDSSIEANTEQANDFDRLFSSHYTIRAVFFNGGTAERLYKKHILSSGSIQKKDLAYHRLPSTSPAYAAAGFDEKLERWKKLLEYLYI